MAKAKGDLVERVDAVGQGRARPQRDERVHVGRAVQQRLEPLAIVLEVDGHDRQQQQELRQRVEHRVFRPEENPRQRPAHHVPHGKVEQGHGEDKGPNHPAAHRQVFPLGRRARRLALGRGLCAGLLLQRGAIPSLFHRGDDLPAAQRRIVVVHCVTPGRAETLFSTRAEQAAHVMPVTSYLSCMQESSFPWITPLRGIRILS